MSDGWAETWPAYVREHAGDESAKEINAKSGVSASTVRRWLSRGGESFSQPDVETVAAFAREYHRGHLDEALVAAGRAQPGDVDRAAVEVKTELTYVSDEDLLKELTSRLADYRIQLGRHDSKNGLPPHWGRKDPSVGGVQDSDERS